ncbi:hypothetical protein [Salinimonas iocasae]|uniref:Uncharacterized protein n=1 Tax=Salinimonas iocasae TaxID=2572577 RepID=A0A5B7YIM9_9ALTE|nr:hypothetical protein [Salinimonas iocasae]QCZ94369.1 hypothetical protein FBQ74_13225 [Salinimonas iocasae]
MSILDHIGMFHAGTEVFESDGVANDYYARGNCLFNSETNQTSVELSWIATLTAQKSAKTVDGFCTYYIPRIEFELKGYNLDISSGDSGLTTSEIEDWALSFSDGMYDEILPHLPVPKTDLDELEDCLEDRQ